MTMTSRLLWVLVALAVPARANALPVGEFCDMAIDALTAECEREPTECRLVDEDGEDGRPWDFRRSGAVQYECERLVAAALEHAVPPQYVIATAYRESGVRWAHAPGEESYSSMQVRLAYHCADINDCRANGHVYGVRYLRNRFERHGRGEWYRALGAYKGERSPYRAGRSRAAIGDRVAMFVAWRYVLRSMGFS